MSAAVAWDVAPVGVGLPPRPTRPQLVSVPCGDELAPARGLRLTRAGRLCLTAVVAVTLAAVAIAVFSGGVSATVIDRSTTVRAGQTLSEIAARQLPELTVSDAVARIEVVNNLTGSQIHAGQTLLIPAVG